MIKNVSISSIVAGSVKSIQTIPLVVLIQLANISDRCKRPSAILQIAKLRAPKQISPSLAVSFFPPPQALIMPSQAKLRKNKCDFSALATSEQVAQQAYQLEGTVEPARTSRAQEDLKHLAASFFQSKEFQLLQLPCVFVWK